MKCNGIEGSEVSFILDSTALHRGYLLHANSKKLLALLQEPFKLNPIKTLVALAKRPAIKCPCCGSAMQIVKTRIPALMAFGLAPSG